MCLLVLILLSAVTLSVSQDTFYFNIKPQSKDATESSETRLYCDVSERRHIFFQWMQRGKPVVNTTRKYQEDSNLRILRVLRDEDEGPFQCIATNYTTGFSLQSQEAFLNILWIDSKAHVLLRRPKKEEVVAGTDITLKCQVSGNPEPTTLWYLNTFRLFNKEKVRILDGGQRLKLINVTGEDNGVYSCRAENMAGAVDSDRNFILNVKATDSPRLREAEFTPFQLALKYQAARLDCPFEGVTRIDWFSNYEKLSNVSSRHVVYPNGSLYFPRVRPADEGTYRCEGLSLTGPAQTFTSELALADLDDITSQSFEPRLLPSYPIVIPVQERFEIKVFPPQGRPNPDYRWLDRNVRVVGTSGRIHVAGQNLVFESPQEMDSGNYTFVANNTAAEKRRGLWVIVSVPPIISRVPQSAMTEEDGSASFSCMVSGTPYPVTTILWQRDGVPLPMGSDEYLINPKEGTLLIPKVKIVDSGHYACVANTTGHPVQISTSAFLRVTKKLKFRPPLKDTYYLELDKSASISCRAEALTPPFINWLKDGLPNLPAHMREERGTLHIDRVRRTDEGTYMCVAAHRKQGVINMTVNVRIVEKPTFSIRPPNSTTAFEGQPTMLHCMAAGDPRPQIVWDKGGKVIASTGTKPDSDSKNRYTVFTNGTLLLKKVLIEDKGRYSCSANNSAGKIRAEFSLRITQPVEEDEGFDMAKTVIIAVCSAGAYLALVIGLTAFCSYRLLMQRRTRKQILNGKNVKLGGSEFQHHREQHELLMKDRDSGLQFRSDSDNRSHASAMSSHPSHSSASATGTASVTAAMAIRNRGAGMEKFQFPRQDLQTLGIIGKGQFGDVFLAKARSIRPIEQETLVVVKSLLVKGDAASVEFHNEMDMYGKLDHPNVVRLLGVCREMEPYFMITEYCDWGDLKQFLLATRSDNGRRVMVPRVPPLTSIQKLKLCQQVALAMEYLSGYKFIHRDLAARNVLLTSRLDLKVCSLTLCRDVYANEYYLHPTRQTPLPLRWLPPEAVRDADFSFQTDIWSYGIFMWEVFHLCDLPYRLLTDDEVFKSLCGGTGTGAAAGSGASGAVSNASGLNVSQTGGSSLAGTSVSSSSLPRLDFAEQCPSHMVDIVRQCCAVLPSSRPTFSDLVVTLGHLLTNGDCV